MWPNRILVGQKARSLKRQGMELNGCPRGALTHRGVVQRVVERKSRGVLS